jgi:hypothetical protein
MRHFLICLLATLTLTSCLGLNERAIRLAGRHGLVSAVVDGTHYRHQIFFQPGTDRDALFVFIDGDGSPWSRGGVEPARDPTPHRAIALELATSTPHSVLYLGRPCYFTVHFDSACSARIWTSERYSQAVVESLAAVVNRFAAEYRYRRTVLIGYSGGGTLAVLMAPYIASVRVVTIAANLDIAAWASFHNYLPLTGSLNPATQPPLAHPSRQLHLVGGRDLNVPEAINQRFFESLRAEQIWRFANFDHVCCWVEQWSSILPRIDERVSAADQ